MIAAKLVIELVMAAGCASKCLRFEVVCHIAALVMNERAPFAIVGFDLDGTLLDTFRDLGAAVNHALREGGLEPAALEDAKGLIGGGAKTMLARAVEQQGGLPEAEFRALYKKMLAFYSENNAVHTQPFPHAREVVNELRSAGVVCAVVTNKFEAFARDILGALDFVEPFETVIGGDSLGRDENGAFIAKPSPAPLFEAQKRCGGGAMAFVGDTSFDIGAARAAQMPSIAAAYGYCDRPAATLGADAEIACLSELAGALARL